MSTERKKLSNKLDKLWKEAIYLKASFLCEYCGKAENKNAHHIFSRSNKSVRWELDNGVCLCVAHHVFANNSFHKAPIEMLEWLKEKRGKEWYDSLREKANSSEKMTLLRMEEIEKELKEYLNG